MRGLFASTLDILGLIAVASMTVSVIIQSATVVQTESTSITRATALTSTSITQDSPEGFPLIDEFFITSTDTETATATRPSLHSLLHNETGKVVQGADVSWLLDFAIIGFGKCGTSTLMELLGSHPQVACFQREISDLMRNKVETFVEKLYRRLPEGPYKRGYKAPADVTQVRD
jgi:hypothetical protein